MNSRHCEERRNARKEVKKSRIDRETLERPSKIREKKGAHEMRRSVPIWHLPGAKCHRK